MLAVPFVAAALASTPSCGIATARTAVKSSKLTIPASQSISSQPYRVSASQVDGVSCLKLAGGRVAMAVTLASGGTAGDIAWAIFVGGPGAYKLSLVRGGYKLSVAPLGSDLVETDPVYKTGDPNCCPSGGFDHTRWHWNGQEFAVQRTWHDATYKP